MKGFPRVLSYRERTCIWMVFMNLCKKINMKTKSWSDYQSSNIEN